MLNFICLRRLYSFIWYVIKLKRVHVRILTGVANVGINVGLSIHFLIQHFILACLQPKPVSVVRFNKNFHRGTSWIAASECVRHAPRSCQMKILSLKWRETAEGDAGVGVFQCPSEGCIKVYQRYSALEKHLSYEKCELLQREPHFLITQKKERRSDKPWWESRSSGSCHK